MSDLALRPQRYPALTEAFTSKAGPLPSDMLGRLDVCRRVFGAAIAALPSSGLRRAASILFHVDGSGVVPPLDVRRRAADRAFSGRGIGREPDTVQRYLERQILDPLLVEVIETLVIDLELSSDEPEPQDPWDFDAWADDLDRVLVSIAVQDFRPASVILDRWLQLAHGGSLSEDGVHLQARSLMLLGDLRRDQGLVNGPLSAEKAYRSALGLFEHLGNARRIAQGELSLALVAEMSGKLSIAATRYSKLADDERLSMRDRARARLWIGTAVTKCGEHDRAVGTITGALRELDDLDELDEWAVAQQKLALAHLLAGRLTDASRHIDVALQYRKRGSPLQEVRLDVAHAHVLITDRRTRQSGIALLNRAHTRAAENGLGHQLQSIERIVTLAERYEGQARA